VVNPEFAGHAAGIGYVVAAGSPDGERHAVGVHFAHVHEGQRAVKTARENDADGQVSVEPNPDAVLEGGPHQPRGLADVGDELIAVPHGEQIHICGDGRILGGACPSVVARRDFADEPTRRDKRLQFRCHVEMITAARPVERFNPERVTS
jgi:hypothetical protein